MDQKIDFTTPVWLANTWTINGFLTMITSSFGMYIVWFKSSKEMVQYKHFLSSIVAFTTMFDVGMNYFFRPIALFPLWGGFTDGEPARLMGRIMGWMGILDGDVTYLMPVVQVLCYEALVSLVCGFLYRYLALQRDSFILRSLLRVYAFSTLIHIGTTFPCPIFCVLARSPRKEMVQYILEKHPEYSAIVNHTMWVIIDPDIGKGNPWSSAYGYCCLFMCSGYLLMGVTTVYLILRKLNAMKAHMSEKTFQIHKNLLISLCWQSMVPMVMYFVPLLLGQVVIRFGFRGNVQDWMNIFTAVMGTHSMVNTCIMIYFTRPYREYTIQLLNRLGLFRKKTALGVHPQKDKKTQKHIMNSSFSSQNGGYLQDLPRLCVIQIAEYLDNCGRRKLSQTCQRFRELLNSGNHYSTLKSNWDQLPRDQIESTSQEVPRKMEIRRPCYKMHIRELQAENELLITFTDSKAIFDSHDSGFRSIHIVGQKPSHESAKRRRYTTDLEDLHSFRLPSVLKGVFGYTHEIIGEWPTIVHDTIQKINKHFVFEVIDIYPRYEENLRLLFTLNVHHDFGNSFVELSCFPGNKSDRVVRVHTILFGEKTTWSTGCHVTFRCLNPDNLREVAQVLNDMWIENGTDVEWRPSRLDATVTFRKTADSKVIVSYDDSLDEEMWNNHEDTWSDHEETFSDHDDELSDHEDTGSDHEDTSSDHDDELSDHEEVWRDHEEVWSDHEEDWSDHGEDWSDHDEVWRDHEELWTDHEEVWRDQEEV